MTRYVALLRGINVGRNKRIAMPALRAALEGAGFQDVRTLLASGNVVLTPAGDSDPGPERVVEAVERVIRDEFGHDVRVVVRTAAELDDVVLTCPMPDPPDGSRLMVTFLSAEPAEGRLVAPDPGEIGDDRFWSGPREVYVWCPNGLMHSPGMDHLGSLDLGVHVTNRNWNTVVKLAALAGPE